MIGFTHLRARQWPVISHSTATLAASPRVVGQLGISPRLRFIRALTSRPPFPASYNPKSRAHLHQFNLPDTWRGKIIARIAKHHWRSVWKKTKGQTPTKNAPGERNSLFLYFDGRSTTTTSVSTPDSLIFAWNSIRGRLIWTIAHPLPWSKKSRWIRWPAYLAICWYSIILLVWIRCTEYVPITGRRQCRFIPVTQPPLRADTEPKSVDEILNTSIHQSDDPRVRAYIADFKSRLLPDEDHRVRQACSIMERIVSATGLGHLRYLLCIVNDPSKSFDL